MSKGLKGRLAAVTFGIALSAAVAVFCFLKGSFWDSLLLQQKINTVIGLGGILSLISLIGLCLMHKFIFTPILLLRENIKKLDVDELSFEKLEYTGKDEIADLVREINEMLARIERASQDLSNGTKQLQPAGKNGLIHLNYYDKLTGLYSRGYFEYLLDQKIASNDFSFAVVIGDINGLKIVNDTFGYSVGDQMIISVAQVLKDVCRKTDLLCRWDGDAFAMILNNAGNEIAEEVCMSIRAGCADVKGEPVTPSIALGYSIATSAKEITKTIKEAEERMYRHKLFEDQSVRSSLLTSLQRTLEEKSHETQEHTRRLRDYCLKIGSRLRMDRAAIDELLLLALMHDIGKIGIPDDILNKPGELNQEEWEIMKSHSSIGCRIASASPDLSHIAYGILTHHEHYDGSGYPKGLKGTRIPQIARILAVVDAFDVMTHDRPYRKAIGRHEAVEELRRCSGAQFDPDLVRLFVEVLDEPVKFVERIS